MSILQRRTAADQKLEAVQEATRWLEERAQFAYRQAAHHLRSPIAVVDTYIALFERDAVDEAAIKHVLPVIRHELLEVRKALDDLQSRASSYLDDRNNAKPVDYWKRPFD